MPQKVHRRPETTTRLSPRTRLLAPEMVGCPGPGEEIWIDSEYHWGKSILTFTHHPELSSAVSQQDGFTWILWVAAPHCTPTERQLGLSWETEKSTGVRRAEEEQVRR